MRRVRNAMTGPGPADASLVAGPVSFGTDKTLSLKIGTRKSSLARRSMEDLTMMDFDTDRLIGETMAEVLRERLLELETLEATGDATEDTVGKLVFVRKLLVRFDARDVTRP